jgi:hypothetical protein
MKKLTVGDYDAAAVPPDKNPGILFDLQNNCHRNAIR